jgi:hypothetical protein
MSTEEIASVFDAPPPGANLRQRSNSFLPIQAPDLIGVKDRRYLDRTGLELQRDIGDLMRYAAMNQGADRLGNYAGFIPADVPEFKHLPPPEKARPRYSDAQLYALALWLYSLKPSHNPNTFDALAGRGQKVFDRERCGPCHTPPLYTNNKLTPANGFQIPREHFKLYDILQVSVGTDPTLTLRTARGTGYYKVPSLRAYGTAGCSRMTVPAQRWKTGLTLGASEAITCQPASKDTASRSGQCRDTTLDSTFRLRKRGR